VQVTTRKAGPVPILDVSVRSTLQTPLYTVLSCCVRSKTIRSAACW
jgi:hypothetical protein